MAGQVGLGTVTETIADPTGGPNSVVAVIPIGGSLTSTVIILTITASSDVPTSPSSSLSSIATSPTPTSTSSVAEGATPPNPSLPSSTTSVSPTTTSTTPTASAASSSGSSSVPKSTSSTILPATTSLAAGNATSSGTTTQSSSSTTPLIAGIAVLGALLALALVAIALLFWRRKRNNKDPRDEYGVAYELKAAQDNPATIANLENTVNDLETQLHQKDAQLRESQAALLQYGRRGGPQGLNDRQLNDLFARLSKSINDWVVTHFKTIRPGVIPAPDVENTVRSVFPNFGIFLQDPRTKYLVIRGLVAEVIVQAFATGELLGNEAFMELKQAVASSSSATELNEWRAQTATFLEKTPGYRADKASSVQEVSKKIDYMTSNLAGLDYTEARQHHLSQVVEAAAGLAMEIAKHPSQIKVQKPSGTTFDALYMEDVLQDHQGEAVQGRPIQGVVFPSVVRIPDGQGGGSGYILSKAQVLV